MAKVDEMAVETVDQISELPEPIIHHILSLLPCPKDVARTIVLSKKWKTIWLSFYSFDFDQRKFQAPAGNQNEEFINFVENSLSAKFESIFCIEKFRLFLTSFNFKMSVHIDNWICAVLNKNVKDLEIHVEKNKKREYVLPNSVLTAKTITSLKLHGCKLGGINLIDLCKLKVLSIKQTVANADIIQNFICSCPSVEDLRLVNCRGLGRLQISALFKLSRLEIHECHGLKQVEVKSPSLKSFLYCGKKSWDCQIKLAGCESLKYLTIKDSSMTDEMFHDQISKMPVLEKLVLKECGGLERITILSKEMKELCVIRCRNLEEANINAPNLFSLEYTGNKVPFMSMNITGLREAKLHFESKRKNHSLFLPELQKFIERFNKDGAWKIVVTSDKNIMVHEELREIVLPSSRDFKLELTKSSMKLKDLVDNLLRMSRPKTLSLLSSSSSELLEFLHNKIMRRQEDPNCCRYYQMKCWLHRLKGVGMEVEQHENGKTSNQNPRLMSSQTMKQTTFKLQWD